MILSLRFVLSCVVSNGVFLWYSIQLLGRVFNILRKNNPELAGDRRRTVMRPPQVLREGTKKIVFVNFMDLCRTCVWFLLHSTLPILWNLNICGYYFLVFCCITGMLVVECIWTFSLYILLTICFIHSVFIGFYVFLPGVYEAHVLFFLERAYCNFLPGPQKKKKK